MSGIAIAVKHMLAAGMPHDAIVAAVAEMEASATPARSKGALRTERWRQNERLKASQNVTCDDCDEPLDKEKSPTPPKEINPPSGDKSPSGKQPARVKRPAAMPEGWEPILTPRCQAIVDGWPPGKLDRELRRFRDHAADKGRISKDWQAAFRTWIEKADEDGTRNAFRTGGPSGSRMDGKPQSTRFERYAAACAAERAEEASSPGWDHEDYSRTGFAIPPELPDFRH